MIAQRERKFMFRSGARARVATHVLRADVYIHVEPQDNFPERASGSGFSFSWFTPGFDGKRAGGFLLR